MSFKANIAVVGRFHAFNLAEQLQKHHLLQKLITTYPKFIVKRWQIDQDHIVSEPLLELLNRYKYRLRFLIPTTLLHHWIQKKHAFKSVQYLSECDIFIGWSGSSLEALIAAKKLGKTTILERGSSHFTSQMNILQEEYTAHGLQFDPDYRVWQQELLEYELADYISIPSSYVKRTFAANGVPEHKLLINPYGVDLTEFKEMEKNDQIFRIIYAGGGTLRKGYHYLLQAFYELNLPKCELWHLGKVSEEVRPFLKKYHHQSFILKGVQPQNELYKFYSQGSVFVLPSIEEGFAMVQFQAMACGLPLICTTNTGGEDLITKDGEEGFVIPIRDVESLKKHILFLYHHQDIAKEMGQKAKKRVRSGFTWDDYGKRYIKNIQSVQK